MHIIKFYVLCLVTECFLLFSFSVLSATTLLTSCSTVCPNKPGTATINSFWINVSPRWGKIFHRQWCTCILCTWILCELNSWGTGNGWTLCFALLDGAWLLTWLYIRGQIHKVLLCMTKFSSPFEFTGTKIAVHLGEYLYNVII